MKINKLICLSNSANYGISNTVTFFLISPYLVVKGILFKCFCYLSFGLVSKVISYNTAASIMMNQLRLFVACVLCIPIVELHEITNPIVTTPLGKVQGTIITSRLGKSIYSFRGMRYAKAPVNELRFKPPVPIEQWEGIYNATQDGPLCPQPTDDPISEDCLVVNVFSTELPEGKNKPQRPVIVFIHAGGFYSVGSASYWTGPQYYLDQNIVLVTFNYRLGTLGFLSTGDKEAPGNNGLKDQVQVLKWVKQNIASFGGDPESVTIQGYSAGGISVVLHMVSPMSKGLFHKGIAMSESPLGISPIPHDQLDIAKKQARIVGCPENGTTSSIIDCLRTVSYRDLGNSLRQFKKFGTDPVIIWSPVIEPDCGQTRFLTDHPVRLIVEGKFQQIPFITGRTTEEFSYFGFNVLQNETLAQEMNDNFEKIAPIAFVYERNTNFSKYVSRNIRKFYFNNKPINNKQERALENLYEDSIVGFSVDRAAKLIAQYSTEAVYYYRFSYKGRYSHVYLPGTNNTVPYGVVHHDDLIYLFYISKIFPLFKENSPQEVEMVTKLTTFYANFAKTGDPTPFPSRILDNIKWEKYTLSNQKYLDIGNQLVMKEKLNEKRFQEWERLFPLSRYLKND